MNLTKRQSEILKYIADFIEEKGYSPTIKEIGEMIGTSISVTARHIENLTEKGYITHIPYERRTITIVKR